MEVYSWENHQTKWWIFNGHVDYRRVYQYNSPRASTRSKSNGDVQFLARDSCVLVMFIGILIIGIWEEILTPTL